MDRSIDYFRLEQTYHGLSQSVAVGISDTPDRSLYTGLREALRVANTTGV
jgi:hypothetical protein